MSSSPDWKCQSQEPGSRFGSDVAGAGDINGDGYADFVVGARFYDGPPDGGNGAVFVWYGSPYGPTGLQAFLADETTYHLGTSVAGAGDINGDGFSDVAFGAPYSGSVFVRHGSANGLSSVPDRVIHSDYPGSQGEQFGALVASAGDVNGDGFDDLLVGAPYHPGGLQKNGRVLLYLGSATGLEETASWSLQGNHHHSLLGLCGASGDFDGDGFSDLLIGSEYGRTGKVDLYRGSEAGITGGPAWTRFGGQNSGYGTVAGVGDVNGDGFPDALIGTIFDKQAWLYPGSPAGLAVTAARHFQGPPLSSFGIEVAGAGDVNDDGLADILIGAPFGDVPLPNEGITHLYLGTPTGPAPLPTWSAEGNQQGADFGRSAAGVGDVNGDGVDDVLVGATFMDSWGEVYLYYGEPCAPSLWFRDSDGDGYGDPVSTAALCNPRIGYTLDSTDCDDRSPETHPGAAEACDGIDQDCSGLPDDGDGDGDGRLVCDDCDDANAGVWSPPAEITDVRFESKSLFHWGAVEAVGGGETSYDTVRGLLGQFPVGAGSDEVCLAPMLPRSTGVDTQDPDPGNGFWYLIRARGACIGNYGAGSDLPRSTSVCSP